MTRRARIGAAIERHMTWLGLTCVGLSGLLGFQLPAIFAWLHHLVRAVLAW